MTHVESTNYDPLMQGEPTDTLPVAELSPQARLDASRAALRMWIDHTYHPERLTAAEAQAATDAAVPPADANEPAWLGLMVDSLSDVPVASIAVRYLRRWWARHPWRATAEFAGAAGHELLRPTAIKHPWLLLGGAVVAGAALTRLKPWRWISGSAMLASLLPPISLASILGAATTMMNNITPGRGHDDEDRDGDAATKASSPDAASTQGQSQSQTQGPAQHADRPLTEAA